MRSEEHTSELQSRVDLVCRLLLDTTSTEIYTLSLHDALPISGVLAIDVDAKPPTLGGHVGEVQVPALGEQLVLRVGENLRDVAFQLHPAQLTELDRHQVTVHEIGRAHV